MLAQARLVGALVPVEGKIVGGATGIAAQWRINIGYSQRRVRSALGTQGKRVAGDDLIPVEMVVAAQFRRSAKIQSEIRRKRRAHHGSTGSGFDLSTDDRFARRAELREQFRGRLAALENKALVNGGEAAAKHVAETCGLHGGWRTANRCQFYGGEPLPQTNDVSGHIWRKRIALPVRVGRVEQPQLRRNDGWACGEGRVQLDARVEANTTGFGTVDDSAVVEAELSQRKEGTSGLRLTPENIAGRCRYAERTAREMKTARFTHTP